MGREERRETTETPKGTPRSGIACGERTAGFLCLRLIYDFFRAKRVYTAQYIVAFASCLGCLRFGKLPAANPQASRLACIFAF